MFKPDCLFCSIVKGDEPSEVILELEKFIVIKNKFPVAPIHVLVLDKEHNEKSNTISGVYSDKSYWEGMFAAIYATIKHLKLDETGYKLVNNGSGYNHFEHEHFHILGGSKGEPGGQT